MPKKLSVYLIISAVFMFCIQIAHAKHKKAENYLPLLHAGLADSGTLDYTSTKKNPDQSAVIVTLNIQNVSCNGGSNGFVKTTVFGSNAPFTYRWSTGATTPDLLNVPSGNYTVVVKDAVGDSAVVTGTVEEPAPITLIFYPIPVTCNGGNDGNISVEAVGGIEPYQYLWSNGQTGFNLSNLTAGIYSLTITDSNGCTKTGSDTVKQPQPISITPSITGLSCFSICNAAVNITTANGTAPYTYLWSNGATTQNIAALCAGTYTVTVKDSLGCTRAQPFTINNPTSPVIDLGPDRSLCAGQNFLADATITGPVSMYEWTSSNGFSSTLPMVTLAQVGTYYVKATTPGGCTSTDTIILSASNTIISSDFVIASQVFKNKTVTVVNIANPTPDSIMWLIPINNNITVVTRTPAMLELLFKDTGRYTIGMRTNRGPCQSITNKTITVLEPQPFDTTLRVQDPLIRNFTASPNPNNGQFTVQVNLKEKSNIRLRLINILSNATINDRQVNGSKDYTLAYNLTVSPGIYVLLLETPKASRVFKLIIN